MESWVWTGNSSWSVSGVYKLEFSWDQEWIKTVIEYSMFFYRPKSFVTHPASAKIIVTPSAETKWNLWWLYLMKTSQYQRYQHSKVWMITENINFFSPNPRAVSEWLGCFVKALPATVPVLEMPLFSAAWHINWPSKT